MDQDLDEMTRDRLLAEVVKLRTAIRQHRDSSGHDLCWHHPRLWGTLPEPVDPDIAVPPWLTTVCACVMGEETDGQTMAPHLPTR